MRAVGGWNRFKVKLSVADCPTNGHKFPDVPRGLLTSREIHLPEGLVGFSASVLVVLTRRLEIAERKSAVCKCFEIIVMGMVRIWECAEFFVFISDQ